MGFGFPKDERVALVESEPENSRCRARPTCVTAGCTSRLDKIDATRCATSSRTRGRCACRRASPTSTPPGRVTWAERLSLASPVMTDDNKPDAKPDHEPPKGAETTATWRERRDAIEYTASAKWLVLRKKDKPAAEIFSVSYVADERDTDRPVTFVFNGGPGASSAYLHLGAVGPRRVAFPPTARCRLCRRSWSERGVVARIHRSRLRRPRRAPASAGSSSRSARTATTRRRQERGRDRPEGVLRLQARPRVALRVHGPLALEHAAGAHPSSSPARATAGIASGGSCASFRRRPGSG